jgi:uncharacterized delta-60 repeat protein
MPMLAFARRIGRLSVPHAFARRAATLVSTALLSVLADGGCSESDCSATANCSADDAGVADGSGGPGHAASGTVTLAVATTAQPFFLVQGSVTDVPVEITRQGATGAVVVRASGLPKDATSSPVTIPPGETKAMMSIRPLPTTPQGPVEIELEAVAEAEDGVRATAKLGAFVRGGPGGFDTTFAGTGIVASALSSPEGNIHALRVTADGKILLVARRTDNLVVAARYDASGAMDTSFGALGVANLRGSQSGADLDIPLSGPGKEHLYALVKAPSLGGTMFRLGPDGDAAGFPAAGIAISGPNVRALQLAALTTGNALLLRTHAGANSQLKLERWRPDGTTDTFYGCYASLSGASISSGRMVVRDDGSALVFMQAGSELAFTVCDPSGRSDESVGAAPDHAVSLGTRRLDLVAGTPDGGAVFASSDGNYNLTWSRVSAKGVVDTTVGTGGVSSSFAFASDSDPPVMAVQTDGKVILAGRKADAPQGIFSVLRFLPNGGPDPSFGTNGTVTLSFAEGKWLDVTAITLDADGRILLGMNSHDLGDSPIVRLWP